MTKNLKVTLLISVIVFLLGICAFYYFSRSKFSSPPSSNKEEDVQTLIDSTIPRNKDIPSNSQESKKLLDSIKPRNTTKPLPTPESKQLINSIMPRE